VTAIVCVSDEGGILFCKRRLSKDRIVTEDIVRLSAGGVIFVSEYSEPLFSESDASIIAVSNPLKSAGEGDFAFVEDVSLAEYKEKIRELVIYRWNRKYPYDTSLDINPEREGMALCQSSEFKGKSHERITREIWRK
jgi:hypothetical protein